MKLISCHQSFSTAVDLGFNVYDKRKLLVAELVQAQQYVICTTDIWTSPVHDSLLSLTAHFITTDFEKKLQAVKFSKSQPVTTLQA